MKKSIIILGLGSVSNKLFLLILPYLLNGQTYYQFNSAYYTASMISVLALLGFNFTFAREQLSRTHLLIYLIINLSLFSILFSFFRAIDPFIIFLSVGNLAIAVTSTVLLFKGKLRIYFYLNLVLFISVFSSLLIEELFSFDLFYIYSTFLFMNGILFIRFLPSSEARNKTDTSFTHYRLSFNIFLINSAAGFFFSLDKFLINNYFSLEIANAYTFAWTVLIPIIYLGNIFEKLFYVQKENISSFLKISFFNALALLFYIVFVIILFSFEELRPADINYSIFKEILIYVGLGLFMFSIIHFPVNGYLFKFGSSAIINKTAFFNFFLLIFGLICLLILFYLKLISIVSIILITFLILITISLYKLKLILAE